MTRTERLNQLVSQLNEATNKAYEIDSMFTGKRLTCYAGSKDVSPRLPLGQLLKWLEGYWAGFELGIEVRNAQIRNVK